MFLRLRKSGAKLVTGLLGKNEPQTLSVRSHLVLLVLASVLPLLIFAALMFWRDVQLRRDAVQRGMRDTARALSLAVDREVGSILSVAQTLAASRYLDFQDFKAFYDLSAEAADKSKNGWVVLFDNTGQMIINTRERFGAILPNPLRESKASADKKQEYLPQGNQEIETVLKTGKPVFSDLFIGLVSKLPLISVTVPVVRQRKVIYAISIAMPSNHLTDLLHEQGLPNDWMAVLVDRKGIIIARTTAPEKFVGRPTLPQLKKNLSEAREGWNIGQTRDGIRIYYAFARSNLTSWGIALGAPQLAIDAPMNYAVAVLTGGAALLLAIALGAAFVFGRRITVPISRLAQSAEAIQRGEKIEFDRLAVTEIDQLHRALVDASAAAQAANAALLRDIEERKKLESQLLQSQKMESIGTLAGGIAHDFNNLLNIIQGYAFLLGESDGHKEQMKESLAVINETVQRGSALVQQLLTVAQKTGGTRVVPLSINLLVQGLVKIIKETFPKTIEINSSLDPNQPRILADKTQIEQVLLNMVVNARDAMPEGGSLTVSTSCVEGSALQLGKSGSARYVCVKVADTGMGMDQNTLSRLFEPFFTTKDKSERAGLGLSVVYGIVKNHQGHIEVDSKIRSGTVFRLYFPVGDFEIAGAEPAAEVQSVRKAPSESGTVFVVEDEAETSRVLERILMARGYNVLKASDGEMAIEVFHHHKHEIDVVLLDMGLPKVAGKEVLREMKDQNPAVKVVVASGYFATDLKADIDQAGIKDFLQKPYRPDEVVATLRNVIERQS